MGIIVFFGLTVGAIWHAEGVAGFKPFANMEALLLVLGGTFCATLVNYPLKRLVGLGRVVRKVMFQGAEDTTPIVGTFVAFAQKAKREGFLSLQQDVSGIKDD